MNNRLMSEDKDLKKLNMLMNAFNEVKAEENVKSKSLRTFIQNNPELKGIRISMNSRKEQDWLLNLPLYDFKYDL